MSFMLQFFVPSLKTAKPASELHNKVSFTSSFIFSSLFVQRFQENFISCADITIHFSRSSYLLCLY